MTATVFLWLVSRFLLYLLMIGAAMGVGLTILRKIPFHSPLERIVFSLAAGFTVFATLFFIVAIFGGLRQGVAVAFTLAGCALLFFHVREPARAALPIKSEPRRRKGARQRENQRPPGKDPASRRRLALILLAGAALLFWAALFLQTQYPPTHWDAVSNHLVFAREQIRAHGLTVPMGIPNPVPPALNHYLFVWGMLLGGDTLAQGIQHSFMLLVAAGMVSWGHRSGRLLMGMGAAALWLGHPLVLILGESGYIDVGLAAAVFLGVYALRIFAEEWNSRHWLLGMALFGMAAGTKSFGLFFCALGFGFGCLALLRRRLGLRSFLMGCAIAGGIALPWYGFIAWATGGNPFWPLLPQLASGVWAEKAPIRHGSIGLERTLVNFLLFPIKMVTEPVRFSPDFWRTLNPAVMLWPLAWLLALKDRSIRWWTVWALLYSMVWFFSAQFVRYWLVVVPLVGLGIAESVEWLLRHSRLPARITTGVWVLMMAAAVASTGRDLARSFELRGWPPATHEQREIYAASFISSYGGVRHINRNADPGDIVYTMNAGFLSYWIQPRVIDFFSVLGAERAPSFRWPEDERWLQRLKGMGADWILIRHLDAKWLAIPEQDIVRKPFWPGFRLVYADAQVWVFRRES